MTTLPTVTVFLNDGTSYVTSVSLKASDAEIKSYFRWQWFNMGNNDQDCMKRCIKVEIDRS